MSRSGTRGEERSLRRSSMLLWVLGGLVCAALALGGVAGALREPAALDPDRPEGVVQAYLQAVLAGDNQQALAHLTQETADRCGTAAFRHACVDESLTASLEEVHTGGDEA